jgi:membrane-bound lytic murein transglycosylase MltF
VSLVIEPANAQAPEVEPFVYPEGLPSSKHFAYELVLDTWSEDQWVYFDDLIRRESGWNNLAQNRTSTAFGMGQFLDSTWKGVGCVKTTDSYEQIRCTIKYIENRYKTPENSIRHHNLNNFY